MPLYRGSRRLVLRRNSAIVSAQILPSDLTGLIAWYKADTGITPGTDGIAVTQWSDNSGGGNHQTANGAGATPVFHSAGFNGRQSVTFNAASSQMLTTPATFPIGTGTTLSVFMVGQMLTGTQNFGRAISYTKPVGGANDFDNPGSIDAIGRDATNLNFEATRNNVNSISAISLATNYRLGVIVSATGVMTQYINGVAQGSPGTSAGNWVSAGNLCLGNGITLANYWDGPMAEVVVATSDCTSQVAGLDLYFKSKWGL